MSELAQERTFAFRPLYLQVKETLVRRLVEGTWQPGQLIPSEMELARELGVSQGTVRKALDVLAADNLLIRKQGRGTFVAEPEESRILFKFFRLLPDTGERAFPNSKMVRRGKGAASRGEAEALGIAKGSLIWRIERIRAFGDDPLLVETIALPAARFPGLEAREDIPNNVYLLYSQGWGITIASARERLKAVSANAHDVARLNCPPGTALLEISRVAYDLEHNAVEFRVSRCLTARAHYLSDLK